MIKTTAALVIRAALTILVLYFVWRNSHWSVCLSLGLTALALELHFYDHKKLRRIAMHDAFDSAISLCLLELQAIKRERGADPALLKIRMDTVYANLGIAVRLGYATRQQKDSYRDVKYGFFALQKEHGIFYDNDDF